MSGPTPAQLLPIAEVYSAMAYERYQSGQRLKEMMPEKISGGAGSYRDWVGGKAEMIPMAFGAAELPTQAVKFTPVVTTPLRFILKTAIAASDQTLTNIDLRTAHTQAHGLAAARMVDLLKLKAVFNNPDIPVGNLTVVPTTVGANTGLITDKLLAADVNFNNEDVPFEDRFIIANSDQFRSLLEDSRYNDSRISSMYPLKDAVVQPYVNFKFLQLAKQATNSISVTENVGPPITYSSYALAVQYDAMKMEFNMPMTTSIEWDGPNKNYVIVTELVANAQIIQQQGTQLIALELDENGDPIDNPAM